MKERVALIYKGKHKVVLDIGEIVAALPPEQSNPLLKQYVRFALALSAIVEDPVQIRQKLDEVFNDFLGKEISLLSIQNLAIDEDEIERVDLEGEKNHE